MLLHDPYAGHRDSFSGKPDAPLDEWTAWDFALAQAIQIISDGTTEDGHLMWEIDADDVDVIAVHHVDKARQAREIVTGGDNYKAEPGEYYRTKLFHPYYDPESGEPERWQTRLEWIAKIFEEDQG